MKKERKNMKKGTGACLSLLLGAATGAAAVEFQQKKRNAETNDLLQKMGEFYKLLLKWLEIEQKGISIRSFFL